MNSLLWVEAQSMRLPINTLHFITYCMVSLCKRHGYIWMHLPVHIVQYSFAFQYFRIEHQRLHEKHKGHEAMHAEMVLILIATLVIAQILLVQWKQRYFRSYQVSRNVALFEISFECMQIL